jgi:hypothetical protein
LFCVGCADTSDINTDTSYQVDGGGDPCSEGEYRCLGNVYQQCAAGTFTEVKTCNDPMICVTELGCAECDPSVGKGCKGNNVHSCDSQARLGAEVKSCLGLTCVRGECTSPECAEEARLIYVVDRDYKLLSFDPAAEDNHFTLIGELDCPAGDPIPPFPPPATPFSMSVDRSARGWVLYRSGEIFWVSTKDASCTPTPFEVGQEGYGMFGMGFVADTAGSAAEKLYIAGISGNAPGQKTLSFIDPATLKVHVVGSMGTGTNVPELTGTGDAMLYSFHAHTEPRFVAKTNKQTGELVEKWDVAIPAGQVTTWAFAHWGGKFYIFITLQEDPEIGQTPEEKGMVLRLNPDIGETTFFLNNLTLRIVGAGVSTCAPLID